MNTPPWLFVSGGYGWRQRLTCTWPMMLLTVVDGLVGLLTLGFLQPGLAREWGFRWGLRNS